MKDQKKPTGSASSLPSNGQEELSPVEQQAVQAAEAIAQGQDASLPPAGAPSTGGGGTAAPPPPALAAVTNAGRLAARTVDKILARLFGPAGPLPPEEAAEAETLWSELLKEIGIALPSLGPGAQLMLLYGTHVGTLYAITWLTEPERPSSPGNQDAARPPS